MTVLAELAKGLRMPSTADELAADTRNAASRFTGSRNQGFCWSKEVAMAFEYNTMIMKGFDVIITDIMHGHESGSFSRPMTDNPYAH